MHNTPISPVSILCTQYKPCTCMSADYMLQKFMHNYQQDKQGANYFCSCAQRMCGNASATQKVIQAAAEAGDACHAQRTAPSNLPPSPEILMYSSQIYFSDMSFQPVGSTGGRPSSARLRCDSSPANVNV